MRQQADKSKADFIKFAFCAAEHISSDKERAIEFLREEGLDADAVIADGLKRIRAMRLKISAERKKSEMSNMQDVNAEAAAWVDKLLADASFSFADFVRQEHLVLQNRNIQSLSTEDVKNTLIKYYSLKLLEERKDKEK